ncbi:NDUFA12-domain-containing protein [Irpex rosettiformis]|uniref:NDUFA12-domain-containing protein n=1 Tax=Irpex rosettiformis TaxID=378272 RepID=A0ACB8UC84_9APHY|nr:NDUFA12-domain-containing protein [Irpex rosettiformis]
MVSLARTIRSIRRVGLKEWWHQMQYIGDAKSGTFKGKDQFGNRYFENMNPEEEIPGRHRWVDFAQHDYNATQVPPEWHAWLSHIRKDAPQEDAVVQRFTPPWKAPYIENLTGTRGAYKPYNTTAPKINAWEPKVAPRV